MNRNPYLMTNWQDHIVDMETGQVIQEGTRFTASRANNIEEGIFNAYGWIMVNIADITKMRIQLEMLGRAPANNGTFFDPIDDSGGQKALALLKNKAVAQDAITIGTTSILVDDASVFEVDKFITIFDGINEENLKITNISSNTLTTTATTKAYNKGAFVVRSNVEIKANKMIFGSWGNYNIEVKEVI